MLHPIQRLHDLVRRIGRYDYTSLDVDEQQLPQHIKNELQAAILEKELELADLTSCQDELSDIEAAIASFAGGPDNSNDSEDNADKE